MRLTIHRLFVAGIATAIFSGLALAPAVAAEPGHVDNIAETVSPSGTEPLPGGDSTVPGAALALLLISVGLAWVVRRSTPVPNTVNLSHDTTVSVDEVAPRRPPAGSKPTPAPSSAAA
jgi:hypothetical protein